MPRDAELYPGTAVPVEERDRLWETVVVSQAPQFAEYQQKTERVIPPIRLVAGE